MIVSILMHNFLHRHNPSAKWEQKGSWGTRDGGFPQLRFCTVLTWLMDGWNIRQREFAPDVARASLKISWLHSGGAFTIRGSWLKPVVQWFFCSFPAKNLKQSELQDGYETVLLCFVISVIQHTAIFGECNCLDGYALGFWSSIQEGKIFVRLFRCLA